MPASALLIILHSVNISRIHLANFAVCSIKMSLETINFFILYPVTPMDNN